MKKLLIITTVPMSLATLIKGQPKYLSNFFDVTLVSSSGSNNLEIEESEGVKLISVDMSRQITPLKDLKSLWKLYLYMRESRPDIVYSFTPKAGLLGMIASCISRVPIRIHNIVGMPLMEVSGVKKSLLKLIEKITYMFSTRLFCNSYGLKEYIYNNLTKKEIKVIANGSINGVDGTFFKERFSSKEKVKLRESLSIHQDSFVLTFVGRIVRDKGLNELIAAFGVLQKEYKHLELLLVGDFEEELSPIEADSIDAIKNNKSITLVGFQKDVRPYLEITDLFVLPSYREGLPNSLIEAGSFGIPLLATNINGCNEIIKDKENGILVKIKSIDSLKEGIRFFLDNPKEYQRMKNEVRESTLKRYNQEYLWQCLGNELEKE